MTHPLNVDPYTPRGNVLDAQDEELYGTRHPPRFESHNTEAYQGRVNCAYISMTPELSLPTNPTEGTLVYTGSGLGNQLQFWNGTVWVGMSSSSVGVAKVLGTAGQITVSPNTGTPVVSLPNIITEAILWQATQTFTVPLVPQADNTAGIGTAALRFANVFAVNAQINNGALIVGTDPGGTDIVRINGNIRLPLANYITWGGTASSYLQVDGTPQFLFSLSNTIRMILTASALSPDVASGITLGTVALPWGASDFNGLMSIQAGGLTVTAGNIGVGTTPGSGAGVEVGGASLSGQFQNPFLYIGTIDSSASTGNAAIFSSEPSTKAAVWTLPTMYHFLVLDTVKGAGSVITTQYGLYVASLAAAGTNFAIFTNTGPVSIGDSLTVRSSTVGIGITAVTFNGVYIQGVTLTGGGVQTSVVANATLDSTAVTLGMGVFGKITTAAAAFTMASGAALYASDAVLGAGSAITNQYGVYVQSQTKGATNYAIFTNTGIVHLGDQTTIGTDPGGTDILRVGGALTINDTKIMTSKTSFTNNAAANTATLTNAPAAGNPTKWIPINDNGVTRNIPAW